MRDDILKYLGGVAHSTAKTIAERIGVDRLEVAKELNHMHADAIVEREKRPGAGNEYFYWLSRADSGAGTNTDTASALPAVKAEPPPTPSVQSAKTDTTEEELRKEIGELMGAASFLSAKLDGVEQERDDLRAKVFDLTRTAANRQDKILTLETKAETYRAGLDEVQKERDELVAELQSARHINDQLQQQITSLNAQLAATVPPLGKSVADALRPFVVGGQKVIWREPFRWHDDAGVMPNHFEGLSIEALAESFNYDVVINCQLAAIIKPRERETNDASHDVGSLETH
jgi:hypothetical protein